MSEHLSNYSARDYEVVDYQTYELPGSSLTFRGPPQELIDGEYITCLGAAQTFGCFCEEPYPALLAEQLATPVLNLGYGGAGPRFFARQPALLEIVNRGRLTIVQVMSGRSEDNSLFESRGLEKLTRRRDGREMAADDAWRSVLELDYWWKLAPMARESARRWCRRLAQPRVRRLAAENLANYVASFDRLLDQIETPVVLLWFSRREPAYDPGCESVEALFGAFPQLVDRPTVDHLAARVDAYVECVTERGMPQTLLSRFDGSPVEIDLTVDRADFRGRVWRQNNYYPSPEMQQDAAMALSTAIGGLGLSKR
ncbi:DUF6473 family protein [Botrimarina colliarenosi]|uniref:DUF6473 family protein n=1 Tax=Botrimarina colliarenosi TaxID=2528001 RepID=UPI0011B6F0B0|nr:DUF6473 family protein [Botrimarina colliarenosi]